VSFASEIAEGQACDDIGRNGPLAGLPVNLHFWSLKLLPGETVDLALTGVTDPTTMLEALGAGTPQVDAGDGPGDSDRAVSFTNPASFEIYVRLQVSTADGGATGYSLSIDGP
jgi:hypothetical protein